VKHGFLCGASRADTRSAPTLARQATSRAPMHARRVRFSYLQVRGVVPGFVAQPIFRKENLSMKKTRKGKKPGKAQVAQTPAVSSGETLTLRLNLGNKSGTLGRVTTAIGRFGGDIGGIDIVGQEDDCTVRDITV